MARPGRKSSSPVRDPGPRHQARSGSATGDPDHLPPCSHATRDEIAMYDMYPWNRSDDAKDEAADALQTALDRRDNGGESAR
ncbi:hypothetical protein Plo01_51190 [Planobispora longispora]|uniref:Uncharacterized protein n=1 Tax=Planobispora longispora TaxID=28887 RepID=A0A8J3RPA8_9ACTN|nr:hypothetical protein Plo01_51190 [Planobispora longispora]